MAGMINFELAESLKDKASAVVVEDKEDGSQSTLPIGSAVTVHNLDGVFEGEPGDCGKALWWPGESEWRIIRIECP